MASCNFLTLLNLSSFSDRFTFHPETHLHNHIEETHLILQTNGCSAPLSFEYNWYLRPLSPPDQLYSHFSSSLFLFSSQLATFEDVIWSNNAVPRKEKNPTTEPSVMHCIELRSSVGNVLKISIDLKLFFRRCISNSHLSGTVDINCNHVFSMPGSKINQGEALN